MSLTKSKIDMKSKNIVLYVGLFLFVASILMAVFAEIQRFQLIAGFLLLLSLTGIATGWAMFQGKT